MRLSLITVRFIFGILWLVACNAVEIIAVSPDDLEVSTELWNDSDFMTLSESFQFLVDFHICNYSSVDFCAQKYPSSLILLDFSTDFYIQYSLSRFCHDHQLIHLVYQSSFKYSDNFTYSTISSLSDQMKAFLSLMDHFNWTQGVVFNNKENYQIKEFFFNFSSSFSILTIESYEDIENLVNQTVTQLGATLYYILVSPIESIKLQNALKKQKLLISDNGILLNQDSAYGCSIDGSLITTESGMEFVSSSAEHYYQSIKNLLNLILQNPIETFSDLLYFLESEFPNHYNKAKYSIVNIQNGKRVVIGSIVDRKINFFGNLTFLGSTSTLPESKKKVLELSITAGTTNPGAVPSTTTKLAAMGAFIAQDEINAGNAILPNFQITMFNFDCGVSLFNSEFATACYKHDIGKIGLSHLTAFGSNVAIGQYQVFKNLSITVPSIGSTNGDGSLASSANYPLYVRLYTSLIYSKWSILLNALGWKKIVALYEYDTWGIGVYQALNSSMQSVGIDIINSENSRHIPGNLDRNGVKNYTSVLQTIIDTQVRLIVLMIQCPMCNYVIEAFYDMGLRRGDIVILAGSQDILASIATNDTYLYKRVELAMSMTRLSVPYWVGTIGEKAKNDISVKYSVATPNSFGCYYYDSFYLIAHAMDFMINRGYDYTDPYQLMLTIRNTKFTGCSGLISIGKGTNDRNFEYFYIEQTKVDGQGIPYIHLVGKLWPFGTQLISYVDTFLYPDETPIKPTDLRNANEKCPFPSKDVKTFVKGRMLVFGICFTVGLVTVIITFFIWKKWWNIPIEELRDKQEISFQDFIVGVTIAIEFVQFCNMGPDFSIVEPFLFSVSDLFSMNLESVLKLKNGVFWIIVDVVYGGIALWVILCLVVLYELDEKWKFLWIFRLLGWLGDILMPILGNLCFIPFVSICLDVFLCDQSIGDNFTDSFLSVDCYYFCWKDTHLIYAIFSFFALLAYEPFAVFCRPLWQEFQPILHVKTLPLYLMVKTIVQIIIIVLSKTLQRAQSVAHGVVYVILMAGYAIFIFKMKPYNYARFSWWQGLSITGVVWLSFLSAIGLGVGIQGLSIPLLCSWLMGWIILVFLGLYIQFKKFPSMLITKSTRDTSTLFRFAFTFGNKSKSSLHSINKGSSQHKTMPIG
ncbi:unnamed protein product [Blepharisma stoltei]|uniref:Receptor ligand binding region domain-containing protein n=1 Tax=Blepharisma stoltei TaxID=1481888 RepID=A0AAU9J1B4_9CILI|nr:unnamed protein product [Blepharisma stoltei]